MYGDFECMEKSNSKSKGRALSKLYHQVTVSNGYRVVSDICDLIPSGNHSCLGEPQNVKEWLVNDKS